MPLIVVVFQEAQNYTQHHHYSGCRDIALWMNRYLIVVPTLESPYLPIQDAREAWRYYSPHGLNGL
jgi:molybdopterin-containing oxidoreductase family membrane subunit